MKVLIVAATAVEARDWARAEGYGPGEVGFAGTWTGLLGLRHTPLVFVGEWDRLMPAKTRSLIVDEAAYLRDVHGVDVRWVDGA